MNTASLPFVVNGTNYRAGATVTIMNSSSAKTVTATSVTPTQIKCSLPLTGLPIGLYNLILRNTDGSNVTQENALAVTNPSPTITSVTPVSGYNTGTVPVTITGTKFIPGATIALLNGSASIPGSIVSLSAAKITGTFLLAGAPSGRYNLTISNPVNANGTKLNAFTVLDPGSDPVISSINPASGFNNANLPVTISGSNFRTPTVYLNQGNLLKSAGVTPGKTQTSTTLYVTLPLIGIPGGLYNITTRNSDGVNATAEDIFYVTDMAWISSMAKPNLQPVVLRSGIPSARSTVISQLIVGPSIQQVVGGR